MTDPHTPVGRSTLAHDLRGPLITLEGFVGEIDEALGELEDMLRSGAPAELVVERLAAQLADDLRPCLDFVGSATRSLHERIDTLRPTGITPDDA